MGLLNTLLELLLCETLVKTLIEECCCDGVLKADCQKEREPLKATEVQFEDVKLQSHISFKSCLICTFL